MPHIALNPEAIDMSKRDYLYTRVCDLVEEKDNRIEDDSESVRIKEPGDPSSGFGML